MANPEHIRLLRDWSTDWPAWKASHPGIKLLLDGIDLEGGFRTPPLEDASCRLVRLSGHFHDQIFARTDLCESEAKNVSFHNCDFTQCQLQGAHWEDCDFHECRFVRLVAGPQVRQHDELPEKIVIHGTRLRPHVISPASEEKALHLDRCKFYKCQFDDCIVNYGSLFDCHLMDCELRNSSFAGADLRMLKCSGTIRLDGCVLISANLVGAELSGAVLHKCDLRHATLFTAMLSPAHTLQMRNLKLSPDGNSSVESARELATVTRISESDLSYADLAYCNLSQAVLESTTLIGCEVFGIACWGISVRNCKQRDLRISENESSTILVDDIEVAPFVSLVSSNHRLREMIDLFGQRAVLILGRFSEEGMKHIQSVKDQVRRAGCIPIVFDFECPESRSKTETVQTLALLCGRVIVNLSDPRSVPHELATLVPSSPRTKYFPIIRKGEAPYGLFDDILARSNVSPLAEYASVAELESVIEKLLDDDAASDGSP